MSRFYGSVEGSASSPATRQGTATSGITGHIRGWDLGVRVDGDVERSDDTDTFLISVTFGSNGGHNAVTLATVSKTPDGLVRVKLADRFGGGLFSLDGEVLA